MKKIILVLAIIIVLSCCGCSDGYSFEYKSMPEEYEAFEKEFTVHYTDVSNVKYTPESYEFYNDNIITLNENVRCFVADEITYKGKKYIFCIQIVNINSGRNSLLSFFKQNSCVFRRIVFQRSRN